MTFILKKLPWAENALEPIISSKTIFHHYHKHHAGYVNKLNGFLADNNLEHMNLKEIIIDFARSEKAIEKAIWNNAAQHYNHEFYWDSLTDKLIDSFDTNFLSLLSSSFENLDNLRKELLNASLSVFGSGWVWLTVDDNNKLHIEKTSNADQPVHKPLLVLDVWEHAYYLDYQQDRGEHIKAILTKIDWEKVASRIHTQERYV